MRNTDPEIVINLLKSTKTNQEIGNILGKHHVTISRERLKLGIPAKRGVPQKLVDINCRNCKISFLPYTSTMIYCSQKCAAIFNGTTDKMNYIRSQNLINHRTIERGWGKWKKNPKTPEFRKYSNRVAVLTKKVYQKYKDIINPNNYKRTLAGVEGGYQLDHIISVKYGFDHNIPPEEISDLKNLQMLPWKTNLNKRDKISCSDSLV